MKRTMICLLASMVIGTICGFEVKSADDTPPQQVSTIYNDVEKLILEYYPEAKIQRKDNVFTASFDTRTFMIHHALKTGEWQEARPQMGPNRKGIICGISFSPHRWQGAAVVPQSFNNRYFQSLLMAPYNKKLDMHLVVHLDYPDGTSPEFQSKFNKVINSFVDDK